MKNDNFGLSPVQYINEIFPLVENEENMPVSFYMDDLKEAIVSMSEWMITADKDDRDKISRTMCSISSTYRMLSEMRDAVVKYAIRHDREEKTK